MQRLPILIRKRVEGDRRVMIDRSMTTRSRLQTKPAHWLSNQNGLSSSDLDSFYSPMRVPLRYWRNPKRVILSPNETLSPYSNASMTRSIAVFRVQRWN